MHRHKKRLKIRKDGSYEIVCDRCDKVLFKRPPIIERANDRRTN